MDKQILSKNVEVFPIAKPRTSMIAVPGTRIFTEDNISNLIRQLLPTNQSGFVISAEKNSDDNFDVSFNIYGYYFKIFNLDVQPFNGKKDIYAYILIENGEIFGSDKANGDEYYYTGLTICDDISNIPSGSDKIVKYIKILSKVNNEWRCSNNFGTTFQGHIGGIDGKYKK